MSLIDGVRHRLRAWFNPDAHERDLADEFAYFVERETEQQQHDAQSPAERAHAPDRARRAAGNRTQFLEYTRRAAGLAPFDAIRQDARFALRSFRASPGFTAIVVITLALGIGATTAMFSAVNALLLRPLPFREPQELMALSLTIPSTDDGGTGRDRVWSYPKVRALRDVQRAFRSVTAWTSSSFTLRSTTEVRRVEGEYTDAAYFPTLGIPLARGHNFPVDDARFVGGEQVAIVSDVIWRQMLHADSTRLGSTLDVDGRRYVVIGVAPPAFRGLSGVADVWMPVQSAPTAWQAAEPYEHRYFVVGRLAPGVSEGLAEAAMSQVGAAVDAAFPGPEPRGRHWSATARPLDSVRAHPQTRLTLFILLGAVGLLLLTTCANVATLLLARASARTREFALRLALGATRARLVRQLLVESLVLALMGALASTAVAVLGVRALAGMQQSVMGSTNDIAGLGTAQFSAIRFDVPAFLVTAALALGTGVLFGLVPALVATRASVATTVKERQQVLLVRRARLNTRDVLTATQIAFAVVLLLGSGLMLQSVRHLLRVETGFEPSGVLAVRVNRAPEWSRDSIDTFYDRATERLGALPGVTGVAMADCPPLVRCNSALVELTDRPPVRREERTEVGVHWVSPAWNAVWRTPVRSGRALARSDDDHAPRVVLVSETAARRLWPGDDPIGRRITLDNGALGRDTATVVGVVADVLYNGMGARPSPDVYVSYYQTHLTYRMMLFVRVQAGHAFPSAAIRRELATFAPGFPVYDWRSLADRVGDATAYPRMVTVLLATFAVLALFVASIGTYGIVSFGVAARTNEIGVRVALGATRRNIASLVATHALALTAVGGAAGLAIALVSTRLLRSLLFGVTPSDPATVVAMLLVLGAAMVLATLVPARRALDVQPASVLRMP